MKFNILFKKIGLIVLVALAWLLGAWGVIPDGFGQDAAGNPAEAELLQAVPFDRITLLDGSVLTVDPLSPRPLPPYDPSKSKARRREKEFGPPPEGNIGLPGEKSKVGMPEVRKKADDQEEVTVHLLQGEVRDFKVKRSNIKRVEYFEETLLAEGDRRLQLRDYTRAFECYLRVQLRNPGWAGIDEHVNRLLFAEGSAALSDRDGERGMRLLRELFARQPDFPDLADKLAEVYADRIARAFELGLYARGRKILHDAESLALNHSVLRAARDRFIARARELVRKALQESCPERLDDLAEALRVWPALEGAGAQFTEAFAAEPTLDVAVTDIPPTLGPWIHSPADERVARLLYLPILVGDEDAAIAGKMPGQLADRLDSSDLGRKLSLRLRQGIIWSDGSRPVSAVDVLQALADRSKPDSPLYSARWADLLDQVEAPDESRVEIRLTRGLLKPAAWLLDPLGPSHTGWGGRLTTPGGGEQLVGDGLYRWVSSDARQARFRASGAPRTLKVRRIREVRFAMPGQPSGP